MKAHVVVDCESSVPCPCHGSMICFGAFVAEPDLARGWRSETIHPYSDTHVEAAYASIGMTHDRHLAEATQTLADAMRSFDAWLTSLGADRVVFWSDNPAFDWQWINHGFAAAGIANPFGFSARRIGDLYAGLTRNFGNTQGWKKLRETAHDHDPLNDAKGNAEALVSILRQHDQLDKLR
ncbi:3'-5' exoribonuclease [Sphingomonas sp. ZT3P38]|uniref:3'-5' exoribonuclease domain-containing protein n=1 Tax=Parasphingomonas zepuensis TaxID=3096161 RepID=UPI002FC89022